MRNFVQNWFRIDTKMMRNFVQKKSFRAKPRNCCANQKSKDYLVAKVINGEANEDTYEKLCKFETALNKVILAFIEKALQYAGNPIELFTWCEKLENHLSNHVWQTIPSDGVKYMLLACITGEDRQEIALLQPTGDRIALDTHRTGEFFTELLKKFSKEKEGKGRKLEYNNRRQTRIKDPRRYYTDKLRLLFLLL